MYYFTIISSKDISAQSVTCFRCIRAPDVIPGKDVVLRKNCVCISHLSQAWCIRSVQTLGVKKIKILFVPRCEEEDYYFIL
jgi:hypothetical protein